MVERTSLTTGIDKTHPVEAKICSSYSADNGSPDGLQLAPSKVAIRKVLKAAKSSGLVLRNAG